MQTDQPQRRRRIIAGRPVMVWVIVLLYAAVAISTFIDPAALHDLPPSHVDYVSRPEEILWFLNSCLLVVVCALLLAKRRLAFHVLIIEVATREVLFLIRIITHEPYREAWALDGGAFLLLAFFIDVAVILYLRTLTREGILR